MPPEDDIQKAVNALPPRTVRARLAELLSLRARQKTGEDLSVPVATFHLKSGRDLTGGILDGELEGGSPCLLLLVEGGPDVAYLDPSALEALTVKGAPRSGVPAPRKEPGKDAPGKEEVPLRLQALCGEISRAAGSAISLDVAWEGIPELPETRRILGDLVEDIGAILKEIAGSEKGRKALAGLKKVWIGDGPRAAVARQSDTLVITANFAQGLEGRLIRGSIRVEIEKLL